MNDVKTWADIDASPLLQLPPEQRKKLHIRLIPVRCCIIDM